MTECDVCFRKCRLDEGRTGLCNGRVCKNGKVVASNYGKVTSVGLDPIEKKPLMRYKPGSWILSVGTAAISDVRFVRTAIFHGQKKQEMRQRMPI